VADKIKAEGHRRETKQVFLAELHRAKTVDDVRHIEAQSAQIWWTQWAGFRMRFAGTAVPAKWHSWRTALQDASLLAALAASNAHIARWSMCSVGRDSAAAVPTCSGIAQSPYAFSAIFEGR
jgi:hypothetical protein